MSELLRDRMSALVDACRAEGSIDAVMRVPELAFVAAAVAELWHLNRAWEVILDEGRPGFTKTGGQLAWMRRWQASEGSWFNGSGRQRGKSLNGLAVCDHAGRAYAHNKMRWTGLTHETARGIVEQAMADYFVTCPLALRPKPAGEDWVYPNGSLFIVIGTDAKSFRRGRGFGRIAVDVRDEYGFYQRPLEVDAALDAGLLVTGPSGKPGRVLYSTTPSDSPAHESNVVAEAHFARGAYEHETLYDNPRVDPELTIRTQMEKTGQTREQVVTSTAFRREYMGERVVEEARAATPRWTAKKGDEPTKHALVQVLERPEHVDYYVALDPGKTTDPHAAVLAWFDFPRQLLYFEYELELASIRHTVPEVQAALKALEKEAFGASGWNGTLLGAADYAKLFRELPEYLQRAVSKDAPRQPYLRVGDGEDVTMLQTLLTLYSYAIIPVEKHDKHLHVDAFNDRIGRGQVMVHPRCTSLIRQLGSTIWNEQRTEWVRTPLDHGDLLDDALYIDRSVNRGRDPRPKHLDAHQKAIEAIQKKAAGDGRSWDDVFRRQR